MGEKESSSAKATEDMGRRSKKEEVRRENEEA